MHRHNTNPSTATTLEPLSLSLVLGDLYSIVVLTSLALPYQVQLLSIEKTPVRRFHTMHKKKKKNPSHPPLKYGNCYETASSFMYLVHVKKVSYPCNSPWRLIGLSDAEAPTFSLQSAHR
jgi:hypothetical protein